MEADNLGDIYVPFKIAMNALMKKRNFLFLLFEEDLARRKSLCILPVLPLPETGWIMQDK